ncbi:nuclear transport factor 2 family protein [Sphingomonas trueperi]|uniref:nuclear transport factor 2 family protein n=1 Tax=Sphingomonas sp. 22176 TaxID=3453884 RepID=UPI00114E81D2
MGFFPKIQSSSVVAPEVRADAIDYVNRVNWLFETWDLEGAITAFTPDAWVYHFHGSLHGEAEIRHFLSEVYPYLIPGVSRHASNHIVDVEETGLVAVRYQNLLVRYATLEDAPKLGDGQVQESELLPALWLYSPMLDRLKKTDQGWKIAERYIGGSTTNMMLTPVDTSAAAVAPYLPKP